LPLTRNQRRHFLHLKYTGLGLNEERELRQLQEENGKIERLVADLSLDSYISGDCAKNQESRVSGGSLGQWAEAVFALSGLRAARLMQITPLRCGTRVWRPLQDGLRMRVEIRRAPVPSRLSNADGNSQERRLAGESKCVYRLYTEGRETVRTKLRKQLPRAIAVVLPRATRLGRSRHGFHELARNSLADAGFDAEQCSTQVA
jgi:hypothetical protein